MRYLAKSGFSQSYTYFTWRNTGVELTEYFTELTQTDVREYMRPNLFANTPDILHEYLQHGGRAAFQIRLVLAATLGASYGIYSGYEFAENVPVRAGSEEYLDSEKYQIRVRNFDDPHSLAELIAQVNQIRRSHPALQRDWGLRFHPTDNPQLLAYSKRSEDGTDLVLTVVTLDPVNMQHGIVQLPVAEWGFGPETTIEVTDLLSLERYFWRGEWNYVRLDPQHGRHTSSRCAWAHHSLPSLLNRPCHDAIRTERSPLVQGRRHLPGARARLLRQHQRWRRRLRRPDAEARISRRPRRQHPVAAAVLPVAAARRRLRHRGLRDHPSELRHAGGFRPVHRGGAPAQPPRHHRARHQSHLGPAPMVPGGTTGPGRLTGA